MPWREDTLRNLQNRIGSNTLRLAGEADFEIPADVAVDEIPAPSTRMAGEDPRLADLSAPEAFVLDREQGRDLRYVQQMLASERAGLENPSYREGQGVLSDPMHIQRMEELGNQLSDLSNFRTLGELEAAMGASTEAINQSDSDVLRTQQPNEHGIPTSQPVNIYDTVHPAVADFLNQRGDFSRVVGNIDTQYRVGDRNRYRQEIEQRNEASQAREQADYAMRHRTLDQRLAAIENARQNERIGANRSMDINRLEVDLGSGGQKPIPGLVEDLREGQKQHALTVLEDTLDKYPEVRPLIGAKDMGSVGRLRDASAYTQYADTEQTKISPDNRASLYNQVLKSVDPSLQEVTKNNLMNFEKMFTSGDPVQQQQARQIMSDLGFDKEMATVEKKIFDPKAPVIGGGGYVSNVEGTPDFKYINDRAREVNAAVSNLSSARAIRDLETKYPGLRPSFPGGGRRFVSYDPVTDAVREVANLAEDAVDEAYGVNVYGAQSPYLFNLASADELRGSEPISRNALKFLRDNPVTSTSAISFQTKLPGEHFEWNASEPLPAPVSKAFNSLVQEEAFTNALPGMLVNNSPISSDDLLHAYVSAGNTEDSSSTLRKLAEFERTGQRLPYVRAHAYKSAGFGPLDSSKTQTGYVDMNNRVVPIQLRPGHLTEVGQVSVKSYDPPAAEVRQNVLERPSKNTYYSGLPVHEALTPRSLAAGAGFALLNEALPKQLQQGNYAGAAGTVASDVGTGVVADIGIGAVTRQMANRAPALAARVLPIAGQAGPALAGAGLFMQGRPDSLANVVTNAAAKRPIGFLPAVRANPQTDLGARAGRAIGNEGKYLLQQLLRGRLPYSR